jgi:hypothetical protein
MSSKYPGGIISKTAPTPSGPYADSTAPGVWTLEQQAYWQKLGQWPTAGNVNPNAFIENLFSTWLYTGNGTSQTITNGINLSANGGLVWTKRRNVSNSHALYDTVRGIDYYLSTNDVGFSAYSPGDVTSFNTTGFSLGSGTVPNTSGGTYASWTFREQPKFFGIVTYTGNGTAGRTVAHNLGSVPGCIIVKQTSAAGQDWMVYHRSLATNDYILLNSTGAASTYPYISSPTSTTFTVESAAPVNANGATYVAYLFAHNAGGFGLTGTDNVISCGSYTGTGAAGNAITLGYEAQWVMIKRTDSAGYDWNMFDVMRGMPVSGGSSRLSANTSAAEITGSTPIVIPTATGFSLEATTAAFNGSGGTYIYIAIRRGPMAVPTLGTSVFSPNTWTGNDTARSITGTNFSPDLTLIRDRSAATGYSFVVNDKLRGSSNVLRTFNADSESTGITQGVTSFNMNGISLGTDSSNYGYNRSPNPEIGEFFARAPGFFDEVCYTGSGSTTTQTHNLGVVPEMMIFKSRSLGSGWKIYSPAGNASKALDFTSGALADNGTYLNEVSPTASVFTIGGAGGGTNNSAETYVAYLFATCAGVSKVGSYTGTGAAQTINCGFTGGSRFVLIKRTDSTGDWYVWDSARGIIPSNDPYLLLNSTAAEVTGTDYVDTTSVGFDITSTAPAAINANGGTFIFLAIA